MHHKIVALLVSIAIITLPSIAKPKVDVLIIGGGASGTSAAIAAARMGAKVTLMEQSSWLGGMLTSAGVSAIDGNYHLRGGIFGAFCDSLAKHYGGYSALETGWVSAIQFEPSVGASIFKNMVSRYQSVDLLLNTKALSFNKTKEGWEVVALKDNKKIVLSAKILIDATELGDVAAACGVKYDIGMESRLSTGEDIAPEKSNGIIQDLTYVAILKDFGQGADKTIAKPLGYDPSLYYNSCKSEHNTPTTETLWSKAKMLDYGKLPNGKYMINWPISGNDYYANIIEASQKKERSELLQKAKDVTLGFVYYIQTELGYKNIGLADDEFPTSDHLALIPYHRESRRIHGLARFTLNDAARPFNANYHLYRTGIAVGDYPVDHHHNRYTGNEELPTIHFYSIPSFNVPIGSLIPTDVDNMIVAEKSISVSNLMNGATRLQPVVMQIGEAAGIIAAMASKEGISPKEVNIRKVQNVILENGGYIMPYIDIPVSDPRFRSVQRIGATGIIKGEGKHVDWSNQTWFYVDRDVTMSEFLSGMSEYYPHSDIYGDNEGNLTISKLAKIISTIDPSINLNKQLFDKLGLMDYNPDRVIKRGELAVILDKTLNPFFSFDVNHQGLIKGDYNGNVDPMIGSGSHGHVFVGASVPHGMVQVGPNNLSNGWDWCSGYNYQDSVITGFAQTHLSGTGIADLGDVLLIPVTGKPAIGKSEPSDLKSGFASLFQKRNQVSKPGYYSVILDRYAVQAEMTATERVAFHRYSYPADSISSIILDLTVSPQSLMSRQGCISSNVSVNNGANVEGYRFSDEWARGHKVYFSIRFSKPAENWTIYSNDKPVQGDTLTGNKLKLRLSFGQTKVVEAAVGISFTSIEQARKNLEAEYQTFDMARLEASNKWNAELGRIDFESNDPAVKRVFYTSLYHTSIEPMLFSNSDGSYKGADGQIHQAENFVPYTVFSLWDTYRAVHPLATLIDPREGDYVNSLLDITNKQGRMPVWHLVGCETDCMVGVHSIPVMADAALKGIKGVDIHRVYDSIKNFDQYRDAGLGYVRNLGYIPADKEPWSVAKGLEYCIDDYSVARLADRIGDFKTRDLYDNGAKGYLHYFDKSVNFMRGRLSDGSWRTPFDPTYSKHMEDDYVEGNAWQYTWLVPHDVQGLIDIFGGRKSFTAKLDSLFKADSHLNEGASADITGMIGQYAHGNEPSHHIAYLYAMAGQPHKTADLIRKIDNDFYKTTPDGIIGNEDCGQMSAWYVLSALGFYPVNPVSGQFIFGSPIVDKASLKLVNGNTLRIEAVGNSKENKYIKKVEFNGKLIRSESISYETLMDGGELKYYMSDK